MSQIFNYQENLKIELCVVFFFFQGYKASYWNYVFEGFVQSFKIIIVVFPLMLNFETVFNTKVIITTLDFNKTLREGGVYWDSLHQFD